MSFLDFFEQQARIKPEETWAKVKPPVPLDLNEKLDSLQTCDVNRMTFRSSDPFQPTEQPQWVKVQYCFSDVFDIQYSTNEVQVKSMTYVHHRLVLSEASATCLYITNHSIPEWPIFWDDEEVKQKPLKRIFNTIRYERLLEASKNMADDEDDSVHNEMMFYLRMSKKFSERSEKALHFYPYKKDLYAKLEKSLSSPYSS